MNNSIDGVTVLVPTFNALPFLEPCVESVLEQTYEKIELLIINDGSTDGTASFLGSLSDRRIRVINKPNEGLVKTLNLGLKLATYDWVARLDADDMMSKVRLEKQIGFLGQHPEYRLVTSNYGFIDAHNNVSKIEKKLNLKEPPNFDPFADPNISHIGVLYNRNDVLSVGAYRELAPAEDLDLWLRMCVHFRLAVLPEVLNYIRILPKGMTTQNYTQQRIMWRYVKDCAKDRRRGLTEQPYDQWFEDNRTRLEHKQGKWRSGKHLRLAGAEWVNGKPLQALPHVLQAFFYSPTSFLDKLVSYKGRSKRDHQ